VLLGVFMLIFDCLALFSRLYILVAEVVVVI